MPLRESEELLTFLDDLGKKLTDATHTAADMAKTSADNYRLNSWIREEEQKITTAYTNIGKKYLERYGADMDPDFAEYLQQISASRLKIEEYKGQLRKNKGVTICSGCGAEIPVSTKFCIRCGTPNPEAENCQKEAPKPQPNRCPRCGSPIAPGAGYCCNCGEKLSDAGV